MDQAVSIKDLEQLASYNLPKAAYDYYRAGANGCISLSDNEKAFQKMYLKTKAFHAPSDSFSTETTILGHKISTPICVASTAFQKMAHNDGEIAMAKGSQAYNKTPLLLSSWATTTLEEVSQAAPETLKIFQIYLSKMPEVNKDLWTRVKNAGYKALALTTDTQVLGKRENDVRNNFQLPSGLNLANYQKYQQTHGENAKLKSSGKDSGLAEYVKNHKNMNIGWEIIREIKKVCDLPVIAKGIMCKEDALIALEYGADALFVSNHGARQLDTTPATIQVLQEVVDAVRGRNVEVYFDGGIRRGTDVIKALAIGAKAVFIGRPILWGLAAGGQSGVTKVLQILNEELKEAMIMTGCNSIDEIGKNGIFYDKDDLYLYKL